MAKKAVGARILKVMFVRQKANLKKPRRCLVWQKVAKGEEKLRKIKLPLRDKDYIL